MAPWANAPGQFGAIEGRGVDFNADMVGGPNKGEDIARSRGNGQSLNNAVCQLSASSF
jgi:hypothetical protein